MKRWRFIGRLRGSSAESVGGGFRGIVDDVRNSTRQNICIPPTFRQVLNKAFLLPQGEGQDEGN